MPLVPPEEVEKLLRPHREEVAALEAEVKRLEAAEADAKKSEADDKQAAVTAAAKALAEARKKLADAQKNPPVLNAAYAVAEGSPANARLQLRGDPKRPGDEVPRRFPAALGGRELPPETSGSGRLELADWIVAPDNPLTTRVMVNRIWRSISSGRSGNSGSGGSRACGSATCFRTSPRAPTICASSGRSGTTMRTTSRRRWGSTPARSHSRGRASVRG